MVYRSPGNCTESPLLSPPAPVSFPIVASRHSPTLSRVTATSPSSSPLLFRARSWYQAAGNRPLKARGSYAGGTCAIGETSFRVSLSRSRHRDAAARVQVIFIAAPIHGVSRGEATIGTEAGYGDASVALRARNRFSSRGARAALYPLDFSRRA